MRQIEHNAPGFHYKIYWKMDAPGQNWNIEEIFDWQSSQLQVPDQPTYQRYMIKIGKYYNKIVLAEAIYFSNF